MESIRGLLRLTLFPAIGQYSLWIVLMKMKLQRMMRVKTNQEEVEERDRAMDSQKPVREYVLTNSVFSWQSFSDTVAICHAVIIQTTF